MKKIINAFGDTYTWFEERKTLSEWAVVIAAAGQDIVKSRVDTVVNGRWLKKTHKSGMDALLEQAAKKDGDWCFAHLRTNSGAVSWEFTRPEYEGVMEPGIVIR